MVLQTAYITISGHSAYKVVPTHGELGFPFTPCNPIADAPLDRVMTGTLTGDTLRRFWRLLYQDILK